MEILVDCIGCSHYEAFATEELVIHRNSFAWQIVPWSAGVRLESGEMAGFFFGAHYPYVYSTLG